MPPWKCTLHRIMGIHKICQYEPALVADIATGQSLDKNGVP